MTNESALIEFLAARPAHDPVMAALALSLAVAVDAELPGLAQNAKAYMAAIDRLRGDDAAGSDPFAGLLAALGDPSKP